MMDVEFPLIESELEAIDVKLLSAETTLFWNSEGMKALLKSRGLNLGSGLSSTCSQSGHFCPWAPAAAIPAPG